MQEKSKNISQIKQRILQYIELKNIKKEKFYQETSLCGANFRGKSAESELSSDKIAIILRVYDDISPDWLLLGKGEMLRTETPESIIEKSRQIQAEINNNSDYIRELMETQAKYLKLLEKENERLLQEIDELKQRK